MLHFPNGAIDPLGEGLFLLTEVLAFGLRVIEAETHSNLVWLCVTDMLAEDRRFGFRRSTRYAEIENLNAPPRKLVSELCLSEIRVTLFWRESRAPSERIT